jgi:hypothetical protein
LSTSRQQSAVQGLILAVVVAGFVLSTWAWFAHGAENDRRLPVREHRDKMMGGWIGQMVGVGWGGPTEFGWKGEIIPSDKIPKWEPGIMNPFWQDDICLEMTFVRSPEQYGFDVSIRQAGIDFANSRYGLAHVNHARRTNLRSAWRVSSRLSRFAGSWAGERSRHHLNQSGDSLAKGHGNRTQLENQVKLWSLTLEEETKKDN